MSTGVGAASERAAWWVAVLLAVLGAALLGLGVTGLVGPAAPSVTHLDQGGPVEADDHGFSVWSTDADAYATTVCTAGEVTLLRPVSRYTITTAEGVAFHELARSPESLPAGEHAVACSPQQEIYAGPHADATSATGLRGATGAVLGAALLGLAAVAVVVALLARRRRRRLEAFRVPLRRLDPQLRQPAAD